MENEIGLRERTKVVVVKRRAHADATLDIWALQQAAMDEAHRLYPRGRGFESSWPVITGEIIVARVKVEVVA